MFYRKFILTALCVSVLSGCATPGTDTHEYRESESIEVSNEIFVNREFEQVWSDLVRQLAKGFFVVNNIEKESRLINVSFSSSDPADYIDCGTSLRTFSQGKTQETTEDDFASSTSFKYGRGLDASQTAAIIGYVDRDTSLEGRINVYVAPTGQGTDVSVNVRYILTITVGGYENFEDINGNITTSQRIPPSAERISFNTNQPNRTAEGISCFSRGVLEHQILEMVD